MTAAQNDEFSLLYITSSSREEAVTIGRQLVELKLVACVNILDSVTSIYRWQNQLTEDNEAILIAKTQKRLFRQVKEMVLELHSYDCPCIIELPILRGAENYLRWIKEGTNINE